MEQVIITANRWTQALAKEFGDSGATKFMCESDMFTYLQVFGKAEISRQDGAWHLEFKN